MVNTDDWSTSWQYRLDSLIEYCILAVAFFLPLSLRHDVTSGFLVAGALLWVGKMCLGRKIEFKRNPFDLVVAVFVLLSAASIWQSPDREFSFYNYYHLMGRYIMLYYLVINNTHSLKQVKRLIWAVLGSAVVVAFYGFYQYIHGVDISAFQWVDCEQFPELKLRVFSTLKNPNLLAGYLVTMIALAAGLGLTAKQKRMKMLLVSMIIAFIACLVFTYSRGAWISLFAVIITLGVIFNRRILWLLALIPLTLVLGHVVFTDRLVSILNPTDTSSTLRFALWESSLAMIANKPLLGIGWGSYWKVYPVYDFFVLNPGTTIFHAHNMYLHIAAEIGIPGLLAFVAVLVGHIRSAFTLATNSRNCWTAGLMLGVLAALIGIGVGGLTDYIMYNVQIGMLFWLLSAIVVVCLSLEEIKSA